MYDKEQYQLLYREVKKHKIKLRANRVVPSKAPYYVWRFSPRNPYSQGRHPWSGFYRTDLRHIDVRKYGWGPDWMISIYDRRVGECTNHMLERKDTGYLMDLIVYLTHHHQRPSPETHSLISFVTVVAPCNNDPNEYVRNARVEFFFGPFRQHTDHYLKVKPAIDT